MAQTPVSAAPALQTPDVIGGFGCDRENDFTRSEYSVLLGRRKRL